MEISLAILLMLAIFVGIPAAIGFAVAGVYILSDLRARKAEHARVPHEEAAREQPKTA